MEALRSKGLQTGRLRTYFQVCAGADAETTTGGCMDIRHGAAIGDSARPPRLAAGPRCASPPTS
eukprot:COSAG01_NODE_35930_length_522_cov_3.235294_1_plen_63_part_10